MSVKIIKIPKPKTPYINKAKSYNWGTPQHIKDKYIGWFDPCPYPQPQEDGLLIEWKAQNFVNPPYNKLEHWAKKCMVEYKKGKEVHLLIPARTDTSYFHDYILPFATIEFIRKRLKFISLDGASDNGSSPAPSIMCRFIPSEI